MARILVIDDDEPLRATVGAMLLSGGHEVVSAADGEDGVRLFQQQPFDLVVCDVFMPKKEGLETVKEIRALSAATPIISMTGSYPRPSGGAHLDPDFLRMSKAFGATRVIAKPFKSQELLALIQQCFEATVQRDEPVPPRADVQRR